MHKKRGDEKRLMSNLETSVIPLATKPIANVKRTVMEVCIIECFLAACDISGLQPLLLFFFNYNSPVMVAVKQTIIKKNKKA